MRGYCWLPVRSTSSVLSKRDKFWFPFCPVKPRCPSGESAVGVDRGIRRLCESGVSEHDAASFLESTHGWLGLLSIMANRPGRCDPGRTPRLDGGPGPRALEDGLRQRRALRMQGLSLLEEYGA